MKGIITGDSGELYDEKYLEIQNQCAAILDRWLPILGYEHWFVRYRFKRGKHDRDEDTAQGFNCLAWVDEDWRYMEMGVNISAEVASDLEPEKLHECLVHELVHPMLSELRPSTESGIPMSAWDDHNERVTTVIAKALIRAYHITPEEETSGSEETKPVCEDGGHGDEGEGEAGPGHVDEGREAGEDAVPAVQEEVDERPESDRH